MKAAPKEYMYLCLAGASILLSAAGQLGMKAGMQTLAALHAEPGLAGLLFTPAMLWTAAGICCYGLSILAWLAVLSRHPLSLVYPLLSLSYILVYLGATHWPLLMEPVSTMRTGGTVLIAVGVAIVSLSGRPSAPR